MSLDGTFSGWRPRQLASEGPRYLALINALEQDIANPAVGWRSPAGPSARA